MLDITDIIKQEIRGYERDRDTAAKEATEQAGVQPIKRGKWSKSDNNLFLICSECKEELLFDDITRATVWHGNYGLPPFCPCCGADMRGEDDA